MAAAPQRSGTSTPRRKAHKDADVYALESQMTCRKHLPFSHKRGVSATVRITSVEELERYHKFGVVYSLGDEEEFVGSMSIAYMKKEA